MSVGRISWRVEIWSKTATGGDLEVSVRKPKPGFGSQVMVLGSAFDKHQQILVARAATGAQLRSLKASGSWRERGWVKDALVKAADARALTPPVENEPTWMVRGKVRKQRAKKREPDPFQSVRPDGDAPPERVLV